MKVFAVMLLVLVVLGCEKKEQARPMSPEECALRKEYLDGQYQLGQMRHDEHERQLGELRRACPDA